MATNALVPLNKYVVSGTTTNSMQFTSIPSGYQDLVIQVYSKATAPAIIFAQFNGDTTGTYSTTAMGGDGGTFSTNRSSGATGMYFSSYAHQSATWSSYEYNIMNYSSTNMWKTVITKGANPGYGVDRIQGLWRNSSDAIHTVTIFLDRPEYWTAGTTFTLYGVKSETSNAVASAVSGGTLYSDASYYYRVFNSSDSLTVTGGSLTADILLVGGGGGGGSNQGGGGGAGGMYALSSQKLTAGVHTVVIGGGGVGSSVNSPNNATNGSDTTLNAFTPAYGGGRGGTYSVAASSGGSGGGGSGGNNTAGTGVSGQGNSGGTGGWYGAGGGGKGAAGANAVTQNNAVPGATDGGIGATSSISGGSVTSAGQESSGSYYFAGGGGGGSTASNSGGAPGNGGLGGGGRGQAQNYNLPAIAGTANTGGGGGGGNQGGQGYNPLGAAGGSGIVIVRYAK